jgi:hypothetical protein
VPPSAEQSQEKQSRLKRAFWPAIVDLESAQKAVKRGAQAAFWMSGVTGLVAVIAVINGRPIAGVDGSAFVDAVLLSIIGWRLMRYSKAWAIVGVVYYSFVVLSRLGAATGAGGVGGLTVVVFLAFVNGLRGVLAVHRFATGGAANPTSTPQTAWTCPQCQRTVPHYVAQCRCGFVRGEPSHETAPTDAAPSGRPAQTPRTQMHPLWFKQRDMRKAALVLATVLVLSAAYYFVVAVPSSEKARLDFERQKYLDQEVDKPPPHTDAIGRARLVISLNVVERRVTVANTSASMFVNCMVGVDKASEQGGIGVPDPPEGTMNHTALMDSVVFGGDWLEVNTTGIAALHHGEHIDFPLATFRAYRDGTLFSGASAPWAYAVCRDERTGKDERVTVSF